MEIWLISVGRVSHIPRCFCFLCHRKLLFSPFCFSFLIYFMLAISSLRRSYWTHYFINAMQSGSFFFLLWILLPTFDGPFVYLGYFFHIFYLMRLKIYTEIIFSMCTINTTLVWILANVQKWENDFHIRTLYTHVVYSLIGFHIQDALKKLNV